jgi:pimeloyl-ACP methyl ester carboxylesterase
MSSILRKALKIFLILLGASALLFVLVLYLMRSRTPDIKGPGGRRLPDSVASLEKMTLGGVEQWILIRGQDRSLPVLLFLHGGPGMPMMYLAHVFQRHLEDSFVCVQWDQRGAGKSFRNDLPTETLTVEQILSDARELVQLLRTRFGQDKIYLAGHSWGSYLGMLLVQRHPELFRAYIGIGQVVDEMRAREIAERFIRERAIETDDQEALLELNTRGAAVHEKWLFKYGAVLYGKTGYSSFIWAGLKAPEYGFFDIPKVGKGSSFSSRHMRYDAIRGPLMEHVSEVQVPVYFIAGRHDYTTPSELVEEYIRVLKAPQKRLIWFERSAHFPFFSEPKEFARTLESILGDVPQWNATLRGEPEFQLLKGGEL